MTTDAILSAFFAEYEARTNRALADPPVVDVEATAGAFADCFIQATPNGVVCGKNDQALRDAIPRGLAFYRRIGTTSMQIMSLSPTRLDEHHALAKVHWRALYHTADGRDERIDFDVFYLVQLIGPTPKIFGYVTGDEEQAYREHGLI